MLTIESSFINPFSVDGVAFDIIEYLTHEQFPFRIGNRSCIESPFTRGIGKYRLYERDQRDFKLVINPVQFLYYYGVDSKTIVYTFWDTSTVPLKYVNMLNEAHKIIVSSQETKRVFINSGVIVDIQVIPLGYHPLYFYRQTVSDNSNKFRFGCSGQITDLKNDRKDIQTIIDGFSDLYKFNTDVELSVKITPNSSIPNTYGLINIKIINDCYTDAQMGDWYRSIACYINVSKYESFGKQPLEAMACGIPVISTIHSGTGEYMTTDNVYNLCFNTELKYDEDGYPFNYYSVNKEELLNTMRYVVSNPDKIKNIGMTGYMSVINNKKNLSTFLNKFEKMLIPYIKW